MLNTVYLRFNTTRGALKDKRVRKAISMALDRRTLADKVAREGQVPAHQFVTPGIAGYKSNFSIKEDVPAAKALLAEAGFPEGKGFPAQTALFISDEQSKNVITAISAMLKKNLGINVAPKNLERGIYYDALDALNFDIARSSYTAKFLDAKTFLDKFTGDNTYNNLTGFKSAEYDKLVDQAENEPDLGKRNGLWAQAEKILVDDEAVLVPLYNNTSINMWKPEVKGLHANSLDAHPLKDISVDGKVAKK
jgi:oligopeptide transport system substrate-binding protein